jgi:putative transposase
MVVHPSEYPWSSYRANAIGMEDKRIDPHAEYLKLGRSNDEREVAYRQLFRANITEKTLNEIRAATNKAWILGNDRFKSCIQKQLGRRVAPKSRGGDRRSDVFRKNTKINRV